MKACKGILRPLLMKLFISYSLVFVLSFLLLSVWPVWGASYYVKSDGNNDNDGLSDATAWRTIAKVQAAVKRDDIVYFRSQDTWTAAGLILTATEGVTYDGSTYGSGTRATLKPTANSSASFVTINASDVVFKGFNLDGGSHDCYGALSIGYRASTNISNITVDNCIVHDIGVTNTWMYGIYIGQTTGGKTTSNVNIINTTIYNTVHEGIAIYPSWSTYNNRVDTVLLRNCNIYNTGTIDSSIYGTGIAVNNNSANVTIEFCNIHDNNKSGIDIRVSPPREGAGNITDAPTNLIVRYNIIRNNGRVGVNIANERSFVLTGSFYNNIFIENGGIVNLYKQGADVYINSRTDVVWSMTGSTLNFYNNTFNNTAIPQDNSLVRTSFRVGDGFIGNPTINLRNNIFYVGDYPAITDWSGVLTHSNNLIYLISGNSYTAVQSSWPYTSAVITTPISVTVWHDATYTYFDKIDGPSWSGIVNQSDMIQWTGFSSPVLGENLIVSARSTDNRITVYNPMSKGYIENIVTGVADATIGPVLVGVYTTAGSTYFTRAANDATDWRTLAHVGGIIRWNRFSNSAYNDKAFTITEVGLNYIAVAPIYNDTTETGMVTAVKATRKDYKLSTIPLITMWENNVKTSNPNFIGGILPTGFTGIYGTNLVPNTNYFAILLGDALDNGATLGEPYNGCINGAGVKIPVLRPKGVAYDIGAYEYVVPAPTGLSIMQSN